jgi:group II intron reverse transcriptase/maturase
MRIPKVVMDNLLRQSKRDKDYVFERIYRNLYNKNFFLEGYSKIASNEGNMTKGTDGKNIDGMSIERIDNLIEKLKDESYQPNPSKRIYIPKKSGGQRPLGIPSMDDKLVQEVARRLLEAIYEPIFKNTSHGFRPEHSCHTAITKIQRNFTGTKWFVEGDIKGFFDNIDHHILIGLLRKKIKDEKFIRLIWKFLKAGYLEDWQYHKTYSGTPQGGIISPLLANIYLHELDAFIEKYFQQFDKGKKRKRTKEYRSLEWKLSKLKVSDEEWLQMTEMQKQEHRKTVNALIKKRNYMNATDPFDSNFRRLYYVRYADDFIIGLIGSKKDAETIKQDISEFLLKELKLELSHEKTLITHGHKKKARFLGYDITMSQSNQAKRGKDGKLQRQNNGKVKLYVPKEKWVNKLLDKNIVKIDGNNWKMTHRPELINNDDLEILSMYDAELRGFYQYYKLANNVSVLNKMAYFMEYSMYKTFARKYRISVRKVINKFSVNGVFTVQYNTKSGRKSRTLISSFKRDNKGTKDKEVDILPNDMKYSGITSLIDRLKAEKCEYCGTTNVPLEMHHVRKLKDLKKKKNLQQWERIMIARNRKTLALCAKGHGNDCHKKLHNGQL